MVEVALELRLQGHHPRRLGCHIAVTACCYLKQSVMLQQMLLKPPSTVTTSVARPAARRRSEWSGLPSNKGSHDGVSSKNIFGSEMIHRCNSSKSKLQQHRKGLSSSSFSLISFDMIVPAAHEPARSRLLHIHPRHQFSFFLGSLCLSDHLFSGSAPSQCQALSRMTWHV